MAILEWDKESERMYETGVDRGVLYKKSGANWLGSVWNGLTAVTESPSGAEANDLWADNIKYATIRSTEQFGFTIEAYMYPEEFATCDGSTKNDAYPGVRAGQQKREKFGFCFRTDYGTAEDDMVDTDVQYKLHLIWGCSASPSERSYSTINDSPEAITFSWECTATPQTIDPITIGAGTENERTYKFKPTCSMIIEKTAANAAKVEALETILYGSNGVDPRLPSPYEVLNLMKAAS